MHEQEELQNQPTAENLPNDGLDEHTASIAEEGTPEIMAEQVEAALSPEEEPLASKSENQPPANESESAPSAELELAEMKDKYLRLYADFENFRRRNTKEKADLIKNANESLLKDFLTVLDDFERAQKSMQAAQNTTLETKEDLHKEVEALRQGIDLVYQKMVRILESKGLKAMPSSQGQPFDLELHESITQIPAPSEDLKGKVIDEIEKGYYLHDKVIRFAKVVLGS